MSLSWHCCPWHDGIVAVDAQAYLLLLQLQLLPSWQWCCCRHWCAGVLAVVELAFFALVSMALLPLIHNGIVALVTIELLLSSSWHHCYYCNGVVVIINVVALVTRCQAGVVTIFMMVQLPLMRFWRQPAVLLALWFNEVNHAPVGWQHSLSPGSPPDSTVEYKQEMTFYSWTKIRSGYAAKVVGEHSHLHLPVGKLTKNANLMTAKMGQPVQLKWH